MKKKVVCLLTLVLCLSLLTGCCFHKEWYAATCEAPKTCVECGETEGDPLGHNWVDATCTTPRTCSVCNQTEGEVLPHNWVDATCTTPKTCSVCALTEGDILPHDWADATTEAPKTCTACALTEGERIITDSRFTTAATKDIQGLWSADVTLTGTDIGLEEGIMDELTLRLFVEFRNDGVMTFSAEVPDEKAFMSALIDAYVEVMYAEFASLGLDKEAAEDAMKQTYGMGVREYLESTLGAVSFNDLLASIYSELNLGGVYYIEDGKLFTGLNWSAAMTEETYVLDGDTLVIESLSEEMGCEVTLSRITE